MAAASVPQTVARAGQSEELGSLVRVTIGLLSAVAGIVHVSAARDHATHRQLATLFVVAGLVQLVQAGVVAVRRSRAVLLSLLLVDGAFAGAWMLTRTVGLTFVPGLEHVEAVGVKDALAVTLELLVAAGALVLLASPSVASRAVATAEAGRSLRVVAASGIVLVLAAAAAPPSHTRVSSAVAAPGATRAVEAPPAATAASADGHVHAAPPSGWVAAQRAAPAARDVPSNPGPATTSSPRSAAEPPTSAPVDTGGQTASVRYGPFTLPPASAGGTTHRSVVVPNVPKVCSDCHLTEMRPNLVYADGSAANMSTGPMLHHAVWLEAGKVDTTCSPRQGIGSQGRRFFAAGNERTVVQLPAGFGYYIDSGPWALIYELMNHGEQPQTVFITLDVRYRPGSDSSVRRVTPVWLDINNCQSSEYAVPAGPTRNEWRWTSTLQGRVVFVAGHVHDGGQRTTLSNQAAGQHLCTSTAGYGRNAAYAGHIESMSVCVWDRLGTVARGDTLLLEAFYDSPEPQSDVMGIDLAYVYETDDLAGGSPAAASATGG